MCGKEDTIMSECTDQCRAVRVPNKSHTRQKTTRTDFANSRSTQHHKEKGSLRTFKAGAGPSVTSCTTNSDSESESDFLDSYYTSDCDSV